MLLILSWMKGVFSLSSQHNTVPFSVKEMIAKKQKQQKNIGEKVMPWTLLLTAIISILTTLGILFTLITETFHFFGDVPFKEFFSGTTWYPFSDPGQYGILPLISGTLRITFIAIIVAVPIGLAAAIYLSEYATDRVRRIVKPILEVLAGIPTIVYGFFALTFVTPLLQNFIPNLEIFNALSPGILIGIMITPTITSLSDDAMNAVPKAIREGALAMGATKWEVTWKVVLPAAVSGIVASIVLAFSRAVGETMITSIAGGSTPNLGLDVTSSVQTMTAYIVQIAQGDAGYGTTIYYSIYAVGFMLFLFTLIMNLVAQWIRRRVREEY